MNHDAIQALPLCPAFMCGKNRKRVVKPAWCVECKSELSEPWASKHAATKKGEGHTVTPEEVEWEYEPKCKWYTFCRPELTDPMRGKR